jgi:histidinol-phosphate phosphatase family protein
MADRELRPALFLDRDGTLIVDVGYPRHADQVQVIPDAAAALGRARKAGFALVVVSNQSGIGRGLVSAEEAAAVHARFVAAYADLGVRFDASYYCPHGPEDGCPCRKPQPGLLLRAAREHGIDIPASFMIGDKVTDVETAHAAGCRGILLAPAGPPAGPLPANCVVRCSWREIEACLHPQA